MSGANSHSNGHPADPREQLREVRQQLKLERARAELTGLRAAHYSTVRQLQEGYDGYSGYAWGDLIDPMDAFRDADLQRGGFPLVDRGYARRDGYNRPFIWSDLDLDLYRSTARWLATRNRLAIGALANLKNYTIKTGIKWEAKPHPRYDQDPAANELAEQVTEFLRDFHRINHWPQRERDGLLRSVRDGEVFIRHFPQPDGQTWTRWVEPEQVQQPLGSPTSPWSFGVRTDPHDVETAVSYAVVYHHPDDWLEVPAAGDEMTHFKRNVDSCVKRGLSDFYATGDPLNSVAKMLDNMAAAGQVQAAIAWIEQFAQANAATVGNQVQAQRDQNRPQYQQPITGKTINYQKYEPGSILKVGAGKEYLPSPQAVGASVHIQIVQAGLRSIGARWCMPEYMISGDSSNANYASTLVSGSPFVNAVECEQHDYVTFYTRTQWVAVRHAANSGLFVVAGHRYGAREVEELLEIHGTPPQVAIANETAEAMIDKQDLETGVTSRQEVRRKRGLDGAKIRQELKEEPVQPPAPPQQGGQAPQQGAPPGGGQAGQAGPFFPRLGAG